VTADRPAAAASGWERRFRAPSIQMSQIAPDAPDVGLVTTNLSGLAQLHRWDTRTGVLTQLTFEESGRLLGRLSPDGRWATWLQDTSGNEIGHWVALSMDGGEPVDLTPGLAPYASDEVAFARRDGRIAFVTVSDDVFSVRAGRMGTDGVIDDLQVMHRAGCLLVNLALSADGSVAAFSSTHRSTGNEYSLLTVGVATGEPGPEAWDGPGTSILVHAFARGLDDHRVLATTNRSGRERAFVLDADTGDRHELPADAPDGDIVALDWSPDGREVLLCRIERAEQRLLVWNLDSDDVRVLDHPAGAVLGYLHSFASYFSPDGSEIVCRWEDSASPRRLIGLDPATGRKTRTILSSGDVPPGHAYRSVSFPSADGAEIQAWIAVPDGEAPFPVVLNTHGGPTAAACGFFDPEAQAFLDHGFAYISVNYHGSTTFGREFEQSIWGRLGDLELQDMAAARAWLIESGIARPDQIVLTGWSYGGYLTLLGLGRQPDLWAGGMAGVAVADWEMNYEDSTDILRAYQRSLFLGGPDEKADAMRRGSPLTYVDDVRAPVLIIQGRNDTRTPARPVERYVERLQARGHPVEIEWFEAGHMGGATDDELAIGHTARMLEFAQRLIRDA
jgi:dienelactone hydrolase